MAIIYIDSFLAIQYYTIEEEITTMSSAGKIVGDVSAIAVGLIVAAALLPTALQTLATGNMTGLSPAVVAVYGLIGIIGALACALGFVDIISHRD